MSAARIVLGVDLGVHGWIACLGHRPGVWPMPVRRTGTTRALEYDERGLSVLLDALILPGDESLVVLEQLRAFPRLGAQAAFSLGTGWGLWRGILAERNLPFEAVRPNEWRKRVCPGAAKGKLAVQAWAWERFPDLREHLAARTETKAAAGPADALALAAYGRMREAE